MVHKGQILSTRPIKQEAAPEVTSFFEGILAQKNGPKILRVNNEIWARLTRLHQHCIYDYREAVKNAIFFDENDRYWLLEPRSNSEEGELEVLSDNAYKIGGLSRDLFGNIFILDRFVRERYKKIKTEMHAIRVHLPISLSDEIKWASPSQGIQFRKLQHFIPLVSAIDILNFNKIAIKNHVAICFDTLPLYQDREKSVSEEQYGTPLPGLMFCLGVRNYGFYFGFGEHLEIDKDFNLEKAVANLYTARDEIANSMHLGPRITEYPRAKSPAG